MLILKQCSTTKITVSAKQTKCGFEPFVQGVNESFTIAREGWTLYKFQECYWSSNQFINLNGFPHAWNGTEWIQHEPKIHLTSLDLISKFATIINNDHDFQLSQEAHYEHLQFEQMNVLSDLIGRMQSNNVKSIPAHTIDIQTFSQISNTLSWIDYFKYAFIAIAFLTLLFITIKILRCCNVIPDLKKITNQIKAPSMPKLFQKKNTGNITNNTPVQFSPNGNLIQAPNT